MRIMTANIWGDYFGNPVDKREENIYKVFENYCPDIVGLQEITRGWYKSKLFERLSEEYYCVGTELSNNTNYVPLMIKKQYYLIAKGYEQLEDTPDSSKAITWAVLKNNDTQKVFGVCNTHFWWKSGDVEHDQLRCKNALQLSKLMRYLAERFECPVFAFGDMNCNRYSRVFEDVYKSEKIFAVYDLTNEHDDICSLHGNPEADSEGNYHGNRTSLNQCESIDHIVSMGKGFDVIQYRVIVDQYALDATDHSPVFADIEFI